MVDFGFREPPAPLLARLLLNIFIQQKMSKENLTAQLTPGTQILLNIVCTRLKQIKPALSNPGSTNTYCRAECDARLNLYLGNL